MCAIGECERIRSLAMTINEWCRRRFHIEGIGFKNHESAALMICMRDFRMRSFTQRDGLQQRQSEKSFPQGVWGLPFQTGPYRRPDSKAARTHPHSHFAPQLSSERPPKSAGEKNKTTNDYLICIHTCTHMHPSTHEIRAHNSAIKRSYTQALKHSKARGIEEGNNRPYSSRFLH